MDERVRVLLKHFIKALSEIYGFSELQTVRKIGRYFNTHDSVDIIKILYKIIQEEDI